MSVHHPSSRLRTTTPRGIKIPHPPLLFLTYLPPSSVGLVRKKLFSRESSQEKVCYNCTAGQTLERSKAARAFRVDGIPADWVGRAATSQRSYFRHSTRAHLSQNGNCPTLRGNKLAKFRFLPLFLIYALFVNILCCSYRSTGQRDIANCHA